MKPLISRTEEYLKRSGARNVTPNASLIRRDMIVNVLTSAAGVFLLGRMVPVLSPTVLGVVTTWLLYRNSAAFALFVFGYYRLFPDAVPALPRFLYVIHEDHYPTAYESWYAALIGNYSPAVSVPLGVLLIFPACLGVFLLLYPLSVLAARRSRGLEAIDFVPVALVCVYTLLMITAPVPASSATRQVTARLSRCDQKKSGGTGTIRCSA